MALKLRSRVPAILLLIVFTIACVVYFILQLTQLRQATRDGDHYRVRHLSRDVFGIAVLLVATWVTSLALFKRRNRSGSAAS